MSELTFEQMLEESLKTIHAGEVVEGTVIDVKPEEVILNIGYKSDGVLTRNEYTNDPSVDMTEKDRLSFPTSVLLPTEETRESKKLIITTKCLPQRLPRYWTAV